MALPERLRASPLPPALDALPAPPPLPANDLAAFPLETEEPAESGPRVRSDRIGRLECSAFGQDAPSPAPFYTVSARLDAWGIVAGLECDLALGEEWVPVRIVQEAADAPGWHAQFDFAALSLVSLATRERALALVSRVGTVAFNRGGPGVVLRLPLERLLGSAFRVLGWPAAPPRASGPPGDWALTG